MEAASYQRIAAAIPASPGGILFISDVAAELEAAGAAGLQTLLCVRQSEERSARPEPSRGAGSGRFPVIHTFDDVLA